jgi:hypothetical protein
VAEAAIERTSVVSVAPRPRQTQSSMRTAGTAVVRHLRTAICFAAAPSQSSAPPVLSMTRALARAVPQIRRSSLTSRAPTTAGSLSARYSVTMIPCAALLAILTTGKGAKPSSGCARNRRDSKRRRSTRSGDATSLRGVGRLTKMLVNRDAPLALVPQCPR